MFQTNLNSMIVQSCKKDGEKQIDVNSRIFGAMHHSNYESKLILGELVKTEESFVLLQLPESVACASKKPRTESNV